MQATETRVNVLVIELVNQQESNFVLDGGTSEDSDLPSRISAPNARKIANKSAVTYIDDKGVRQLRRTRYIKNCNTIFVDEQEARNVKPNPAADVIWVLNGKLTVLETLGDVNLFHFLKTHEGNVTNPDRPDNAQDVFKEINTAVDSGHMETAMDLEFKVLEYLNTLKTPTGNNTFSYKEDALEFLCSAFKLGSFDTGFGSEAWVSVAVFAREFPQKFLNGIGGMTAMVESEVTEALSKGLIALDEVKAFFTDSTKVIVGLPDSLTNEEKKEKLVSYFMNPSNRTAYDELRSLLHNKKVIASGIVV